MTRKLLNRRAAVSLTAALTLGVAGPAAARPSDSIGPYSSYTAVTIPHQQPAANQAVATQSGGSSELEYVLIGVGGAVLVTGGAAVATHRRRHTRITTRAKIAA
jgi:hypothetical protein